MPDSSSSTAGDRFQRLVDIMARLRAPDGCPWDREQNFDTIKRYLLEEAYEVMEAIDTQDWDGLCDELGDLMLQPVFFAQMAGEAGRFRIEDCLDAINRKLVRRHPHVFADGEARTAADVKTRWDEIKAEEKKARGRAAAGLLDGIPRAVPALVEAARISSKAAAAGFDWPGLHQVLDKVREEIGELEHARTREEAEAEVGDLLFTIVNVARFLNADPEQALRRTNAKFRSRFAHVEQGLAAQGKSPKDATIEEMEALWQEAKSI
ncbi:MAG: nucleoside triphosphate pyrophosphohydrolase [Bryobacteraceae bacterium]|nr:nucleoside triphosphate pyrophosphohydrolase [Bryobacteraceae bacterium]